MAEYEFARFFKNPIFYPFHILGNCFYLAWINATCPPKLLYHSPSWAAQGRGNIMTGSWIKTRTGRDHSPVTVMG